MSRFTILVVFVVASLYGVVFYGQEAPLDASEISRDLLYVAPTRAERRIAGDVVRTAYVGSRFEYARQGEKDWWILPAATSKKEVSKEKSRVTEYEGFELVGASDDDRATLVLRNKGSPDALVTATLWDRDQLVDAWLSELRKDKRGLTADGLRQDLEVADPQVRVVDRLVQVNKSAGDTPIVVAVGQSTGESELGLATIVKFEPDTHAVKVFHPAGMLTCEVSTLGVSVNAQKNVADLWFGTSAFRDGAIAPCGGLFRLDTETRAVSPVPGGKSPPIGSIVTMIASVQGAVDVATDAGVCGLAWRADDRWTCWRFVPTVTLKDTAAVANRPGDKPYGQLKAGDYEVLWANQNYLEVATPDSFDAWLAADDFAEAAARNFDVEPYKLLNTSSGGPTPIRPLAKPGGEPLSGALVYRTSLEKLAAPAGTPAGWVKVRARVGWIERKNLDVVPKMVEVK